MIWAYFSRHGDSCTIFSECINVNCSGVDTNLITLRITVIAYINTVGLLFFHHCVHIWVASCLDPSVYRRCFGIWHPNDQFYHMIGMWSPWQGKGLHQVHGILCNSSMHVGSWVLMFSVYVVGDETEVITFIC